jgi:hypothetical protein
MIVTRADIDSKVKELVQLLTKFYGWDETVNAPLVGGKFVILYESSDEVRALQVLANPYERRIEIMAKGKD